MGATISLVAQMVKNLPAIHETWVQSLGWEDPLEKGKATHSSILAWRIPWTVHGITNSQIRLSDFYFPVLFDISISLFEFHNGSFLSSSNSQSFLINSPVFEFYKTMYIILPGEYW